MTATRATPRRVLPARLAFGLIAVALLVLIAGTEVPTPLYLPYRARFGFSAGVLTLVFAVYALALIPALLLFGGLSDRLGRRRVIVAGLLAAAGGSAVLAAAPDTGWLLAGRAVQGLAAGTASGAAAAALMDLEPRGDHRRAALWAATATAAGGASGPLAAGLLAQYAPYPLVLSYLVEIGVLLALAAAALAMPDAAPAAGRGRRPRRPGIPREIRRPFAQAGLTVFTAWSVGALYTSVVPSYAADLLGSRDLALLGGVAFLMLATAAATQYAFRALPARLAQGYGLLLLTGGLAALVAAFPARSPVLLGVSAVVDGVGLGLAFLGAQTLVNHVAPPARRGEVGSAFLVCLYLGVALPVIGTGYLAGPWSLFGAVAAFSAVIGALALAGAAWTLRAAPARRAAPAA